MWNCVERRGILSAKGAERGSGPYFADCVRNDGFYFDGETEPARGLAGGTMYRAPTEEDPRCRHESQR